jgi:hypothetical protein
MRLPRRRTVLLTVALLLVGTVVGGWLYTRSAAATRLVSRKLEERLGTNVQIEKLDVGMGSTSVEGLKVYEYQAPTGADPVISVGAVNLDVSAFGAATGAMPSNVTLHDARVFLRFDKNGDLVTKFPPADASTGDGNIPAVRIQSGVLTIRQAGRPDSVFHGIDLALTTVDGVVRVAGTIEDATWGKWTADGSIPTGGGGQAKLTLATVAPQKVTPDLLKTVPFVNPTAWTQVELAGTTPARLDLTLDLAADRISYRVALEPTGTAVHMPSVGLRFANASGKVVAEEGVVTLENVEGSSADGTVRLNSRMDFTTRTDSLQFVAELIKLDIRKLPAKWKVPPQLAGRLTGKVNFTVAFPEGGGTRTEATGQATLNDASIGGRPTPPIELSVQTGALGDLEFIDPPAPAPKPQPKSDPPAPVVKRDPPAKVDGPPPAVAKKADPPAKRDPNAKRPGLVSSILKGAAKIVKPADAPAAERAYLNINIGFKDVDLTELLKAAGVELPVGVGGKASLQLQLGLPTENPDNLKAYRLNGTIKSKKLSVDALAIEDLSAKLNYRDGRLTVTDFTGRMPGGAFTANGTVDVGGKYPYQAAVKFEKVSLAGIEQIKGVLPPAFAIGGEATVTASAEGTFSPLALTTRGDGRITGLRAGDLAADDLTFRWEGDTEVIHVRQAAAKLFGGELTGSFDIPLRRDTAGSGALKLKSLDLAAVGKALIGNEDLKVEGKADGAVKFRVPAAGEGGPRDVTAELDLQAPTLKVQLGPGRTIPAKKLRGTASMIGGEFTYRLTAEALGGEIILEPPPKKTEPKKAPKKAEPKKEDGLSLGQVRFRSIQLAQLLDVIGQKNTLGGLNADLSGELPLTTDEEGRLVGTGRIRADRIRYGDAEVATTGSALVRLTPRETILDDVSLSVGEGFIRARLALNRIDPDRSYARVTLTNVPARRLFFLFPNLASQIDLPVDGRLTTGLGREWRGSGVVTSTRGTVYGVPVTNVRLPLDWVIHPQTGRSEVRLREASATAAGGQVTAKAEVNLFADLPARLGGEIVFRNVNLADVARETGKVIGNLPISGRFQFSANQFRSADDLSGTLVATLGESQAFALPVLSAILPYIGGFGRDSTTRVTEGEVRAALGRGVWQIQKATLTGPSIDLYAEGSVTTGGRLNLNVVASSSSNRPSEIIVRRLRAIPMAATQPLAPNALTTALSALGNYVVYLEVNGTTAAPTVRLDTLRTVSEGAVRFFVYRFIGP